MKYSIWFSLLLIVFGLSACTTASAPVDMEEQTMGETAVSPTDIPSQPAAPGTDSSPPQPADLGGLTSYRSQTIVTDRESGEQQVTTAAVVLDPWALQMEMPTGELIMTDAGVWMSLPELGWYQMDITAEELALSPQAFMALEWGDEVELPDIPPWPSEIVFMPDQVSLPLVEGGLTPAGQETANGIPCRQYTIVTDYRYEIAETDFLPAMQERMQATGSICVADQSDLPALILQADIEVTATHFIDEQEVVWQHRVEYEITAVNPPITIEPPADAVTLEGMFDDWDDDTFAEEALPPGDLSELDSYRLVITIHIELEDDETTSTSTLEWVNEPRAFRQIDEQEGFTMEMLGVGDQAWMRATGSDWLEIELDEEPDLSGAAHWVDDGEAELVGTAVVNGVNTRHYRQEIVTPFGTGSSEAWVADQPGLPAVIIRSLMRLTQEGQTTTTEVNLYDINQPIIIEPPR
jgi:hypothetical protein